MSKNPIFVSKARGEQYFASTPEDYFIPNPHLKKEIQVDAVNCAISRAKAVLVLLHAGVENGKNDVSVSYEIQSNAIWCIDGLLDQVQMLVCQEKHIN